MNAPVLVELTGETDPLEVCGYMFFACGVAVWICVLSMCSSEY